MKTIEILIQQFSKFIRADKSVDSYDYTPIYIRNWIWVEVLLLVCFSEGLED